jgi:hypothetical protein
MAPRAVVLALSTFLASLAVGSSAAGQWDADIGTEGVKELPALTGPRRALVIGIDDYTGGWPVLFNATQDARLVAQALEQRGFEVSLHLDERGGGDVALDRERLERLFEDFLLGNGSEENARLFVWYAGHGHSIGGQGFLVPADAPSAEDPGFALRAVHLDRLRSPLTLARAKHVIVVFDSCFAGTIFAHTRGSPPPAIEHQVALPVRQFVTSGDVDQSVSDDGLFRELFVQALNGQDRRADGDGDGYLTGSEIGHFLFTQVTNRTRERQTPRWGKMPGFDRGDFVFALPELEAVEAAGSQQAKHQGSRPCWTIEMRSWKQVPLGLIYTIGRAQNPYWVRVEGRNDCSHPLHLTVRVQSDDQDIEFRETPAVFTVGAGTAFQRLIDPQIRFLDPSFTDEKSIKLIWTLTDEARRPLWTETFDHQILPRTRFRFDLSRSDGDPVSKEFLLASLTAWSRLDRQPAVRRFAEELQREIGSGGDPTSLALAWFSRIHAALLSGGGLEIAQNLQLFPPLPNRAMEIRTAGDILQLRGSSPADRVEPLETILAIASMTRAALGPMGVSTGLFAIPAAPDGSPLKRLFLGWRDPLVREWSFLELTRSDQESFEENRRRSTVEIEGVLASRASVARALDRSGVFYTDPEGFLAVDFDRAADHYQIANLE